ncbi:uncharacterized protein E0L32_007051 [Thyridium curvatum]|uniref:Uncharacterized protein n=1 Tax=Thyridium curvatum TaxID=1093900 RepID=A0A507AN35_9PEZI|nr:uncharacterized protein E0L32_007051 [Thyridium curvatum]TPX12165.1 hypothetical protein E0L32_007051 [Thyridium curvatum]
MQSPQRQRQARYTPKTNGATSPPQGSRQSMSPGYQSSQQSPSYYSSSRRQAAVVLDSVAVEPEFPSTVRKLFTSKDSTTQLERPKPAVDEEFVRLLDHLLQAAQTTKFPSAISLDMTDLSRALDDIDRTTSAPPPFKIRSETEFEKHSKVGAAARDADFLAKIFSFFHRILGEQLYLSDWQSNMRNLIKQHASYEHWPDWNGAETSDFVFPDDKGTLTARLIEQGFLDRQQWDGQKPEYYIEVKSTLSQRNREFYMSSNQYKRDTVVAAAKRGDTDVYPDEGHAHPLNCGKADFSYQSGTFKDLVKSEALQCPEWQINHFYVQELVNPVDDLFNDLRIITNEALNHKD